MERDGTLIQDGPAPAGNPPGVGPDVIPGAAPVQAPLAEPQPRKYLDRFSTPEELETYAQRLTQQVTGSQTEVQRLRAEADRERQERTALQTRWDALQAQVAPAPQKPTGIKAVFDAYMKDDFATVDAFEQRLARIEEQSNPKNLETQFAQTLLTAVRPQQFEQGIRTRHPDLLNNQSPLYQSVWQRYDQVASDPYTQLKYPPDPAAMLQITGPDGYSTKQIDLRIVDDLAWQVRAEQGGKPVTPAPIPTVQPSSPGTPGPNTEPDPLTLMTAAERREIESMIAQNALPDNWPRTLSGVAKYRVESWKQHDPVKYEDRKRLAMGARA